jgi:exopolysaccharide biosynthesis polyprenyl glycosylphosphotransferase
LALDEGFRINFSRRIVKRAFDIVVSSFFLVLVAPICAVVALLIKLDSPGPALFTQDRVGLNGKVFRIWKFRSMRQDAEADGIARWASERDPRITRLGHFIRKTRIDEFPQVVNVLLGDMSFIGPRPERPIFVEQLRKEIPFYDLRHRVQPGITGWAQVSYRYGASREDAKKKLCYDLYYVKNNDTVLDLAILLQTVRVILFAHGGR